MKELYLNRKNISGITMIALVITIIVLLILAAVSVATLTGENGILTKAQEAKMTTEKAGIEEQLRLAQLGAKINTTAGDITIDDFLGELGKSEVDYEVTEKNEGSTIITIEGVHIYELIEKDGNVEYESQGTTSKPRPKIEISETTFEGNTIKVKGTTKRNEEGTLEFYIKEENATDYIKKETISEAPSEYEYIFQGMDEEKIYKIKVVAIAKNGETAEKEVTIMNIPTLKEETVTFSYYVNGKEIHEKDWTKESINVVVSTKTIDTKKYTLQTSQDEKTWKDAETVNKTSSQIFTENGKLYARLKDNATGKVGKQYIKQITQIDKTKPNTFTPTVTEVTTNSIKIEGSTEDTGSGVAKYYYSKDNGASWEPTNGTTATEYTFSNLTQGSTVNLRMKAEDNAGNHIITEPITRTIDNVPGLTTANTTFTYTAVKIGRPLGENEYTNGDIKVTIGTTVKDYTLQYKTSKTGKSGEVADWTNYPTGGVTLTRNEAIYARVVDKTGQVAKDSAEKDVYATGNVEKIDKLKPAIGFVNILNKSVDRIAPIAWNGYDAEGNSDDAQSGIDRIGFYLVGSADWTYMRETNYGAGNYYHTFDNLSPGTKYTFKIKAIDKAGNESEEKSIEGSTLQIFTLTYNANGGEGAPTPTQQIEGQSYTLSSTVPTRTGYTFKGWTRSQNPSEDEIKYRLYQPGGTYGDSGGGTLYALWRDETEPKQFTPTVTEATTNSIKIEGSTEDTGSGVAKYYYSKDNGASWEPTNGTTATEYTFSNLTQGSTVNLRMKAEDNAGNHIITEPITRTIDNVPGLTTANTTFTYTAVKTGKPLGENEYTNGDIKVTIGTTEKGYTLQYKTSKTGKSGEVADWTNYPSGGVTLTRNEAIYARVIDSTKQKAEGYATGNVEKIDKLAPVFEGNVTGLDGDINYLVFGVTGSQLKDADATSDYAKSGLDKIIFTRLTDNKPEVREQTYSEGKEDYYFESFNGLSSGTTYTFTFKLVDKAGNESEVVEFTGTTVDAFKVKYDANGGENAPEEYTQSKKYPLKISSQIPTRKGYTFVCWQSDDGALIRPK